jgi:hypothetical protein
MTSFFVSWLIKGGISVEHLFLKSASPLSNNLHFILYGQPSGFSVKPVDSELTLLLLVIDLDLDGLREEIKSAV